MDEDDERLVCLKLLPNVGPRDRKRVRRAYELHRPIEHSNIVRLFDMIELDDGNPGFVMEWVDGVDLERFWLGLPTSHRMSAGERWRWVRPLFTHLLDAVQELHGRGVLHRDLKPQNIIVRPDWQPVVIDLGLARGLGDQVELTPRDQVVGTPLYIPPEVLRRGEPCEAGDFHSLGVMLYQFVVGRPPFVGSTLPDLMNSILTRQVPPVLEDCPDMPPRAAALIDRLLAKLPEDRPKDVDAIRVALRLPSSAPMVPTLVPLQPEPPLVGRGAELHWFRQLLDEWMETGGSGVAGLSGPTGIGKTRLLQACAEIASERPDIDVELTACLPRAPRIALRPLFKHLAEPSSDPASNTVGRRMQALSGRPLLYIVDDVDAADLQTLHVLRELVDTAQELGVRPVLVLVAEEQDEGLRSVAGECPPVARWTVDRLPTARLKELFVPAQRDRVSEAHLLDELERFSGGRPDRVRAWLLEETLSGRLARHQVRWSVTTTGAEGLGPPVFLSICRPERIAGWLQVLGAEVPLELLLACAPSDPSPLLAGLLAAKRAGVVTFRAIGGRAWVTLVTNPPHAVVPDVGQTRELHARAARWLTLHLPGSGLGDEWIAQHWLEAGQRQRAVGSLRRAASESAALGLDHEALRLLRVAAVHRRKAAEQVADRERAESVTDLFERRDLLRGLRPAGAPADRFRWSTTA